MAKYPYRAMKSSRIPPVGYFIKADIFMSTQKMQLHNADVVKKFIFRYLSVPLTDGYWNIFMNITNKDISNNSSS